MSKAIQDLADPELRRFLTEKLALIQRLYQPQHVILFGSRARGEGQDWSDIDIILVSERFARTRFVNRMGEFNIQVAPHRHVDAWCYTPEEFERMRNRPTGVAVACEEGIWL